MNSYTVCARTGCTNRVSYNPRTDVLRHRYCKGCEHEITERLLKSKQCTDDDLVAALMMVVIKSAP